MLERHAIDISEKDDPIHLCCFILIVFLQQQSPQARQSAQSKLNHRFSYSSNMWQLGVLSAEAPTIDVFDVRLTMPNPKLTRLLQ